MSETLTYTQQAVEYGRAGIKVFPVHWNPGGDDHKAPMRGYAWRISATSDPGEIAQDFTLAEMDWGIDGVAIAWATGEDGKVVIDLDRKDIPAWTQAFDFAAATNETGKGWHFICDFPLEFEPGNGTSNLPDRNGVDVRGKGGYIVIAAPDRPGLDMAQLERCQPFPRPDWLVPYRGQIDALDMAEYAAFRERYNHSNLPNAINGIKTRLANFDERRALGIIESRHNKALDVMVLAGEDAIRGMYPFREAVGVVRTWWLAVTADEPARHGREWRNIVCWAAGRAQANLHSPTEPDAGGQPEPDLLDNNTLIQPLDLVARWRADRAAKEWLVTDLLPTARSCSLTADAKAGKSELALYIVACLTQGIDPWTREPREPVDVAYFDFEMTEDDVIERLEGFGHTPDDGWEFMHYYLLPPMLPLDTRHGAQQLLDAVDDVGAQLVVIDTLMRTLQGDENDAVTFQSFYRNVGLPLKQRRITSLRLDHYGKDKSKGSRGSSAKDTDVDVIWGMVRTGRYSARLSSRSRVSWVPQQWFVERFHTAEQGVRFLPRDQVIDNIPTQAAHEMMAAMDLLGVPLSWGRDRIRQRLLEAGYVPGRNDDLADAIRLRKERGPQLTVIEGGGTGLSRDDAETVPEGDHDE